MKNKISMVAALGTVILTCNVGAVSRDDHPASLDGFYAKIPAPTVSVDNMGFSPMFTLRTNWIGQTNDVGPGDPIGLYFQGLQCPGDDLAVHPADTYPVEWWFVLPDGRTNTDLFWEDMRAVPAGSYLTVRFHPECQIHPTNWPAWIVWEVVTNTGRGEGYLTNEGVGFMSAGNNSFESIAFTNGMADQDPNLEIFCYQPIFDSPSQLIVGPGVQGCTNPPVGPGPLAPPLIPPMKPDPNARGKAICRMADKLGHHKPGYPPFGWPLSPTLPYFGETTNYYYATIGVRTRQGSTVIVEKRATVDDSSAWAVVESYVMDREANRWTTNWVDDSPDKYFFRVTVTNIPVWGWSSGSSGSGE